MMESGFEPDEVTLASVVSGCASLAAFKEGLQIHARAMKCDRLRDDLILGDALVDMYAKCGRVSEARCVFDRMPMRNVVSETSLVSVYAKAASVKAARSMFTKMMERNVNEEALGPFRMLKRESFYPTHYTLGNLLNACANLADLQLGRQAHSHVSHVFVGNSLIDRYMKCGSAEDWYWVSWNGMIVEYAQNGYGIEALGLFKKMLECGERPDLVTMIGVLCACSHAELMEAGRYYFSSMTEDYGVLPLNDHYTCRVDFLGRAGCLIEAKNLIGEMLCNLTLLFGGLCLVLVEYIETYLREVYLGRWGDVVRIRNLLTTCGVVKQPSSSWIEIQANMHEIKRLPQIRDIYLLLKMLTKQMKRVGYIPGPVITRKSLVLVLGLMGDISNYILESYFVIAWTTYENASNHKNKKKNKRGTGSLGTVEEQRGTGSLGTVELCFKFIAASTILEKDQDMEEASKHVICGLLCASQKYACMRELENRPRPSQTQVKTSSHCHLDLRTCCNEFFVASQESNSATFLKIMIAPMSLTPP
ncbi:hypothetical protein K2173_000931 [Erythroxylum novogranatense]|uniref:Pentatricopeptide repeat-containing protein n=1 Tax=Erythroxylum novogranatense TaxID=1862640 RepID=A0AAV8TRR7_9ROSI|nr:hypothetical protein K2173_000931 [Erythroxylum novogranatense]